MKEKNKNKNKNRDSENQSIKPTSSDSSPLEPMGLKQLTMRMTMDKAANILATMMGNLHII